MLLVTPPTPESAPQHPTCDLRLSGSHHHPRGGGAALQLGGGGAGLPGGCPGRPQTAQGRLQATADRKCAVGGCLQGCHVGCSGWRSLREAGQRLQGAGLRYQTAVTCYVAVDRCRGRNSTC